MDANTEQLSSRLRPGVECAPWVIEAVRKLEADAHGSHEMVKKLHDTGIARASALQELLAELDVRPNWQIRHGVVAQRIREAYAAPAEQPAGDGTVVADPHHNGACEWRWEGNRLFHRTPASAPWVECKRVSVTPKRIAAIYGALPSEAVGDAVKCPTCGAPATRTEREGAYDTHDEYTYAPPAASVEELARKWRKEARELREYGSEYRCDIANAKAYMLELCVEELRPLIDSAGGAKGGGDPHEFGVGIAPNPKARYWQERADFWRGQAIALGYDPEATPQPDGGAVYAAHPSGDGSIIRKGDGVRLSVGEILAAMSRPPATAAAPDKLADKIRAAHRATHPVAKETLIAEAVDMLAAAPAAPKGGVVDEAMVERARQCIVMLRQHLALFATDDIAQAMFKDADDVTAALATPRAEQGDGGDERCESGDPECGPVEFHDSEGVPLCKVCWDALIAEQGGREVGK